MGENDNGEISVVVRVSTSTNGVLDKHTLDSAERERKALIRGLLAEPSA